MGAAQVSPLAIALDSRCDNFRLRDHLTRGGQYLEFTAAIVEIAAIDSFCEVLGWFRWTTPGG